VFITTLFTRLHTAQKGTTDERCITVVHDEQ
jgi:hypothetical protein